MKYEPKTITEMVRGGMETFHSEPFMATKRDGKWIETSLDQFKEKVRYLATGLYDLGVRKGDKISIHSENSTEWVICDQAILSLGAVCVPIYTTLPGDQIKYILENSEARIHIVSDDEMFSDTKPLMKSIENVEAVISIMGSKHEKLYSFDSIIERGRKRVNEEPELFDKLVSEVDPDDLATLIYTSGTTGKPKGVMLSHNNISSNLRATMERVPFDSNVKQNERMLSYLPLSHIFERLITYLNLSLGYPIYYIEDVDEIRDDFKHVKPFYFATVPRLLEKIHTAVKVKGQEFSGLKKVLYYWAVSRAEEYDPENPPSGFGALLHKVADMLVYKLVREFFGGQLMGTTSGGAALSPNVFSFFNAVGIYCGQGYGLTEMSPVISSTDPDHMRVGSSGRPLSNVQVRIAEDGEIWAKGPNRMKGYYRNEEKTKEVITEDGWLKTGDVGKLEDGYLYITDRKKSVFKLSTGKFVAPQPIENSLTNSGFIEQAVVVGFKRKFCSALIVPNYENVEKKLKSQGHTLSDTPSTDPKVRELIQREINKTNVNFSPWETVKKFVLLEKQLTIEDGELTPTLKVKRPVVNERYQEQINSMYEGEDKNNEDKVENS